MTLENSSAFLFDDLRVERAIFRAFKAGNAIQFEPKAFQPADGDRFSCFARLRP